MYLIKTLLSRTNKNSIHWMINTQIWTKTKSLRIKMNSRFFKIIERKPISKLIAIILRQTSIKEFELKMIVSYF